MALSALERAAKREREKQEEQRQTTKSASSLERAAQREREENPEWYKNISTSEKPKYTAPTKPNTTQNSPTTQVSNKTGEDDDQSWWERIKDAASTAYGRVYGKKEEPSYADMPQTINGRTSPDAMSARIEELTKRQSALVPLISSARRDGMTEERKRFEAEQRANSEEIKRLQDEIDWWGTTGYQEEAERLYNEATNGITALETKRASGQTIAEEMETKRTSIAQMEKELQELQNSFDQSPSEALANQYNQAAARYQQTIDEFNTLYAEYEPFAAAVDAYNNYIDLYGERLGKGREADWKDITWNSLKQGYYNSLYGEESFAKMLGGENDAAAYKDLLAGEDYRFHTDSAIGQAVSGMMNQLGQQYRQLSNPKTVATTGAAVGTALLAGNAGPQALVPEEVLTVPAAALLGYKTGSAMSNMQIEGGLAYQEMLEMGVSEETARVIGLAVGGANAGLEALQLDELLKGLKVSKSAGLNSATDVIFDVIKRRWPSVANNVAQEVAQEGVTIAGTQLGSKIDKGEWAYDTGEVLGRLGDTAVSSMLTFGAMELPGAVVNVVGNLAHNQKLNNMELQHQKMDRGDTPLNAVAESDPLLEAAREAVQAEREVSEESTSRSVSDEEEMDSAQETKSAPHEEMTLEEAFAAFNGGGKYDVIDHQAVERAVEDGSISEVMHILDKVEVDIPRAEKKTEKAAYDAGKANVPRESVKLETPAQEEAYNAGRMAAIAEMGKNKTVDNQAEIETARAEMDALARELGYTYKQNSLASMSGHVQYDFHDQNGLPARGMNHNQAATESELEEIRRNIRQLELVKSKMTSATIENKAREVYSEGENTTFTPAENNRLIKGDASNGEVAEVPDEGRVLEPDVSGQSDGRLLDGLAAENLQADARGGDSVSASEGDGREPSGRTGGSDSQRDVGGRSLGSDQGANLQPASGAVNHVPLNGSEELDNAIARGSNFENSKQRIYEYYKKDPSPAAAINFLKEEYGTGGASHDLTDGTRAFLDHDAKGLTVRVGSERHTFTWAAVEKRIRQLIADGKYYEESGAFKDFDADGNPVYAKARGEANIEAADHKKMKELRAAANEKFGLTSDEGKTLANYTQWLYKELNRRLYTQSLPEKDKPVVKRLVSALKKFPTFKGRTYRNLQFDTEEQYNDFLEKHAAGGIVPLEAFTSTSKRPNGFPVFGEYVAHMVIDCQNGADIADTYGIPRQQEVLLLPGTEIEITSVTKANDGHPLIYVQEVAANGLERNYEDAEPPRSAEGNHAKSGSGNDSAGGSGEPGGAVREPAQDRSGRDGILSERGESAGQLTEEAEVEQKTALATQENARGNNFSIPETGLKLPNGEKARFKANVEAIKTLRTLMAENRRATPAEQEILSKYVGWGGLANAFDEKKTEWAKEYKQLKNLLTEKEYSSARGSTLNAHYTEVGVIRAIYNGLAGLGFKGGRLLEPSAGVGHFAGAMPSEFAGNTSWTMVELDELTGNIAKYLYPNADVRVQGFEAAKIPDNYMDMAISNVPFGNYAIVDKSYPKAVTSAIHNYFFAKALDKVRPGGIVAFITSRFTMDAQNDAVRHYIAQRADLLGAIRLPDSAFKGNAGTEVVTDILILKKRERGTAYGGETFESTGYHHRDLGIWEQTNDYFAEHPEMVLGTASATGSMYRNNSLTYTAKPGNLQKQIEKAFASIKGKMDYPVQRTQEEIRAEIKQAAGKAKNGQIIKKDGKLYRNRDGVLEEATDVGKSNEEVMSAVVELRDAARKLLEAQLDDVSEKQIASLRKALNSQYDSFVKKYGVLNSQKNKRLINLDVDAPFILALENYDKDTKKATKADIFNKNTISPVKTVTLVNTVEEGLIVSMNETGGVDAARIAELLGESRETVTRALLDNRLAFKNRDGKLETAEKYLSGNVKAKLRDAEALAEGDPDYKANVEELRKIIPADIPAEDISVQPGATWIPDSVYGDFVAETLGSSNRGWRQSATVTYNKLLGNFSVTVSDNWLKSRPENISTWGTPDRSFINIFEATLNSKSVTVTRKMDDGSRVVDKQATAAAQEKQEKIRAEFQRWLWADDTRKETLAKLYNDVFNNYVTPKYDGSNLTVNGSNATKPLRPHQKDAVHRIVNSGGNTLLAHKVGAGKTYEMAAAAMKLRQLGIVKKPMFVVPKPLVSQWGNEFLDFFPAAKILVLGDKDFTAANRKLFANRIATGDYDAVILSQEQFKAVPMSVENQEAFYQEQITALELSIAESARANGKRDPSIKQMEKSKKSFEAKLKKLADMKKDEDNIDFEQLGVDALFVDEAHSYKNLFYSTNMNNVSGLGNKEGSQKAFDLYMKVRHLQSLNGGRGIVFATATPVMNSMSEMYIMQKYLQSDLLEARGLHSFDAWASQFGEVRTVLEMNPSGKGFRQKQSFSRFKNLAELQQMFRAFADVLTDIPGLKIPSMKEGKRIIVESEPSEFQMEYIEKLAERADAIKGRKVDPKDDNMLKITSDGRKLSYTQRMIDPALPYEAGNKIMKCADNVLKIWKESKGIKGTQLIFCDLSTPKGSSNVETTTEETTDVEDISIYDDIRNVLIGAGVPAKEIAFIHDANTNEKKSKLFKDVDIHAHFFVHVALSQSSTLALLDVARSPRRVQVVQRHNALLCVHAHAHLTG